MPRAHFNADLIEALKAKVIAHNQTEGAAPVKLQELRKAYAAGYRGKEPAEAAMAKVEAFLGGRLGKIWPFDPSDHPRDDDGKFRSKGSAGGGKPAAIAVRLPKARADHDRLMDDNAGYAAMQTAVIPETRFAAGGALARDASLPLAGIGLAASLARGKPNGAAAKLLQLLGGAAGNIVGGAVGTTAANAVRTGGRLTSRALGRENWAKAALRSARADRVMRGSIKGGAAAGRYAGGRVAAGLGGALRYVADRAAATSDTKRGRIARRAAVIATAGVVPAWAIRNQIRGSVIDPEVMGHGVDVWEAREVRKVLDDPALAEAQGAMLDVLSKGGDIDDLRKAIAPLPGMWSRAGSALWSGAAALGGALAGAGAVHAAGVAHDVASGGKKKGNPYHDEHGKFTSAANAHTSSWVNAVGGLVGAAAAGGLTYAAMRRGHTNLIRNAMEAINRRQVARVTRIQDRGVGRLAGKTNLRTQIEALNQLKAGKTSEIGDWIKNHPEMKDLTENLDRFAGASELHYRNAIHGEVNQRIANAAAFLDDFQIPVGRGDKRVWTTVGARRAEIGGKSSHAAVQKEISAFLDRAGTEDFAKAIAHVKGGAQTELAGLYANRAKWVGDVPTQIAAHYRKVGEVEAKVAQAKLANEAAADTLSQADALHTLSPTPATEAAIKEAKKAQKVAQKAHDDAAAELATLKNAGMDIKSPLTGQKINPATGMERQALINQKRADLELKAERAFASKVKAAEKGIAAARQDQIDFIAAIGSRNRARLAEVGAKYGGLPKSVRPLAEKAATAARGAREAESAWKLAISKKEPKEAIAALKGKFDEANAALKEAADAFENGLMGTPQNGGVRLRALPDWLVEDLRHDVAHGVENMRGAARRLLERPTMRRLAEFAEAKVKGGRSTAKAAARQAFMTPDGKGGQKFSPMKALTVAGFATTVAPAAAIGAHDVYVDVKDAFGPPGHQRDRARARLRQNVEREYNPLTGAGYLALTVPHPTDKGERLVLYGEHQKSAGSNPLPLYAGGKMSEVRRAFKEGRLGQVPGGGDGGGSDGGGGGGSHTGDLQNLPQGIRDKVKEALGKIHNEKAIENIDIPGAGGVRVAYLRNGAASHGGDGALLDWFKNQFLNPGKGREESGKERDGYFSSLNAAFSKQAGVFTARQRYEMLTNRRPDGSRGRYNHGIFGNGEDFNTTDQEKIGSALGREVDRALKLGPTNRDKANLHRAVHIVGVERNLSADTLAGLHKRISAHQGDGGQPAQSTQPKAHTPHTGPKTQDHLGDHHTSPAGWDQTELSNLTSGHARRLRDALGGRHVDDDLVAGTMANIARATGRIHGLDMQTSVRVVDAAIRDMINRTSGRDVIDEFRDGFAEHSLADAIDERVAKAKAGQAKKSADIDDLDGLMKAYAVWDEGKHPRQGRGSDRGGEFVSRAGGAAPSSASLAGGRGVRPSASRSIQAREQRFMATHSQALGEYHPASIASEVGAAAGMQAAWDIASKFLPTGQGAKTAITWTNAIAEEAGGRVGDKVGRNALEGIGMKIAERFLPPAIGAVSMGAKLVASAAGTAAGSFGGEQAARAAYRMAGKELPAMREKEDPLGRVASDTTGNIAGSVIGGAVGSLAGPLGSFGGSVIGGVVGGMAGRGVYDLMHSKDGHRIAGWFKGYSHEAMHGALHRFMGEPR